MNAKIGILALTSVLMLAACGGTTTPPSEGNTGGNNGGGTAVQTAVLTIDLEGVSSAPITIKNANGAIVAGYNNALVRDNETITLPRGTYTVSAGAVSGYTAGGSKTANLSTGNATVTLTYTANGTTTPTTPSGAFYMNADGQMVAITQEDLANAGTRFVFYAWLENEDGGVTPDNLATGAAPTAGERDEVAPLNTQNLAAGYVGYRTADGTVYPVVGAGVRWDINEDKSQTNVRIATADDGALASGAVRPQDVNDNAMSATTFTNRATGSNPRFPSSPDYPLNNVTGVNTPDTDGFTWSALWVPNGEAGQATVTAVAEINGTEINKVVLTKRFAPSARLTITKEAGQADAVGLNQDGNFTVTVTNTGQGPATGIQLQDRLSSGSEDAYSIAAPTGGTLVGDSGFNATFDLAPGESRTFTFPARSSAVGVYCDTATVTQYNNGAFGVVTPSDLNDSACLTVQAPELSITKSLVDADNNPITNQQVGPNQEVFAAITVTNGGSAPATNVVVTDTLVSGAAASYAIRTPAEGTTANGDDGFTSTPFNLAPGETRTFRFGAAATADGTYCDAGSFTATSNNGAVLNGTTDQACFEVVSPNLTITKTNQNAAGTGPVNNLYPGDSYQSVITVTNTGTGAATALAVQDILGQLRGGSTFVNFGSGSYTISGTQQSGQVTYANNTVTTVPAALTLNAGQTLTLTLTSTIPAQAPQGQYCDVASYTSTNGGTGQAEACVNVLNYISVQTQMTDSKDPIVADGVDSTILASTLLVEPQSNEGARNNVVDFRFGTLDTDGNGAGVFTIASTEVYYDAAPQRDPATGQVISNYTRATKLTEGTDYTVTLDTRGHQIVDLRDDFAIVPGGVVFFRHTVTAPAGTPAGQRFSGYQWTANGTNTGNVVRGATAEPTTVIAGPTATPLKTGNN